MQLDKKYHATGSALMVVILSFFMPLAYAASLAFVIGVAKEVVHDWMLKRGTPDWLDIVANVAGISLAVIVLFLIGTEI